MNLLTVTREKPTKADETYTQFGVDRADWLVLQQSRSNALVIGPAEPVEALCDFFRSTWPGLHFITDGCQMRVPRGSCTTLFLRNAGLLNPRDQQTLLEWLSDHHRTTRTIATSSFPIFPLVGHQLLETLYYRLNVITVALRDCHAGRSYRRHWTRNGSSTRSMCAD